MAQRSLAKRLWYRWLHLVCRLLGVALFQVRCQGREHIPESGAVLVLSNHQSHLDPILIGLACDRRLNYLARDSLFGFAPFRWLINSLDAIPLDREGLGLAGLKETLRRLKRGEMVLIFPEGTRTRDGRVASLKPGFTALATRANVTLAPVAIVGAFEAWPRWRNCPWRATIRIQFGPCLTPTDVAKYSERELVQVVERAIRDCHLSAWKKRSTAQRALGERLEREATSSSSVDFGR